MIDRLYRKVFEESFKKKLEIVILYVSIAGFLINLFLIGLNHLDLLPFDDHDSSLLNDPIAAIYTPFSFILIFEVYLLIYYIPKSFTVSVAKQYEVISIILIRKIFKDISNIEVTNQWFEYDSNLMLTVDMAAILLMFLLINNFYKTSRSIEKREEFVDKQSFIRFKERASVFLFIIFTALSVYNLADWGYNTYGYAMGTVDQIMDIDKLFYDDFFTVLVLFDVLILVVSFKYTESYNLLIRNSGFVITTVIIRISLHDTNIINTALLLTSILFGWLIIRIYSSYTISHRL